MLSTFFFFYCNILSIYLFMAVRGLRCCTGFSLVAKPGGYSLVVVCRLLIVVASPVVKPDSQVLRLQ